MKNFKNQTLKEFLDHLSAKEPVPGGGAAAALTAASGAALISMVANYSKSKSPSNSINKEINNIFSKSEKIRKRLLELVDLDAKAYLKVVAARKGSPAQRARAAKAAQKVPLEVCRLCYEATQMTPFLVQNGNKYLLSDVEVAIELLLAAFQSSYVLTK
ncbi:MAG: hypothetical protein A2Z88_09330 [Omnitrophica WOR_2 bacterium GWA2_47_8]|nr:MAG: hypothetical protein A2Z88_09330 [Omnitrophica WOR_2 bacterium GWA2_47_8]